MARRAGCGVAAKGGVIDGCYAAYTTSVTFGDSFSSRRSLCAFGAINNNFPHQHLQKNTAVFMDKTIILCYIVGYDIMTI